MTACPVCSLDGAERGSGGVGIVQIRCRRCGGYEITLHFSASLRTIDRSLRSRISGWIRDQSDLGEWPTITASLVDAVSAFPPKTVPERVERLLRWAIRKQRTVADSFTAMDPEAIAVTYSETFPEVVQLLRHLISENQVAATTDGKHRVTLQGFIEAEKRVAQSASRIGFIAMWFDDSMLDARTYGLEPAIRATGHEPVVVSNVEHINRIDDEIIVQIRRSRFLVADFTGHRGGVYFEAGFALGLGLPVFWTCRNDHFDGLHFDIRQYNCINWSSPAELATRLQRRIEAVVGAGPMPR